MDKRFILIFADKVYDDLISIPPVVVEEISEKIQHLSLFPEMGVGIESSYWAGRQLIVGDYRILYTVDTKNETLTVYHIRHGRRFFH